MARRRRRGAHVHVIHAQRTTTRTMRCHRGLRKADVRSDAASALQRVGYARGLEAYLRPQSVGYGRCASVKGPPTRRMTCPAVRRSRRFAPTAPPPTGCSYSPRSPTLPLLPAYVPPYSCSRSSSQTTRTHAAWESAPAGQGCDMRSVRCPVEDEGRGRRGVEEGNDLESEMKTRDALEKKHAHAYPNPFVLPFLRDQKKSAPMSMQGRGNLPEKQRASRRVKVRQGTLGGIQNRFREQPRSCGLDAADAAARGSRRKEKEGVAVRLYRTCEWPSDLGDEMPNGREKKYINER
ncbi:hypothetical protein DFH06DRAFT_1134354 [Mycena polygramma]|nr:hypothetical protein DFH06DRAFT_1134354 [Mycena polygramma]